MSCDCPVGVRDGIHSLVEPVGWLVGWLNELLVNGSEW
jgi:hypothetical protein